MTVAVIIPSKGRKTLSQTIESLIWQTRKPDEIIINMETGDPLSAYPRMNRMIKQSACDAFVPLADDDMLAPNFIKDTMAEIEKGMDCAYVKMKTFGDEHSEHFPSKDFPFITSAFSKEIWQKIGGYNENAGLYADSLFGREVFKRGKAVYIDKPLFFYRIHKDQTTALISKENAESEYQKLKVFL